MKSVLSKTAYFYSLLIVVFPFVMVFLIKKFMEITANYSHWGLTFFLVLCGLISVFVVIWGFFVEMNMRMATVAVSSENIEIKQLLGFGTKRVLKTSEFDGFITKGFKTRGGYQEYCYLIKNNKAIAVFSSMYYSNYNEVRAEIQKHMKLLQ